MSDRRHPRRPAGPDPAGPAAAGVHLAHVSVEAGDTRILDDVSLDLDARRVAVIGVNGSGKSTLLRVLDGLVRPVSGTVRVHGIDPTAAPRALRRRVGFVFTDPDMQIIMPTVHEDLAFSLRGTGLSRVQIAERVDGWLADHGLAHRRDAPAHSLSGGQKQLLAIGAVLIRRPDLVLADEPTTMLDLPNARRVTRLLVEEHPGQIVIATHDLDLAARCDLAVRFAAGRVVDIGAPARLIADYRAEWR